MFNMHASNPQTITSDRAKMLSVSNHAIGFREFRLGIRRKLIEKQSVDNLSQAMAATESTSEGAVGQSVSGPPSAAAVWITVVPVSWQN